MEKAEKEEELVREMKEVISDAKVSVTVAVWEAKIRPAEDLKNSGSWDMVGWCKALAKLNGKPATASQDPMLRLTGGRRGDKKADEDQDKV